MDCWTVILRLGWDVVLWEPCARMPGYLASCVYVCNGEHKENCNKGCIHPGHLLLITLHYHVQGKTTPGKVHDRDSGWNGQQQDLSSMREEDFKRTCERL